MESNDDVCFECKGEERGNVWVCFSFQSFCLFLIEPGLLVCCDSCPRSFHFVCAKLTAAPSTFVCHVCKQNNTSVVAAAALVEEPVPQDMDAGVAIVPAVEEETVLPPEPGFFFFFLFSSAFLFGSCFFRCRNCLASHGRDSSCNSVFFCSDWSTKRICCIEAHKGIRRIGVAVFTTFNLL